MSLNLQAPPPEVLQIPKLVANNMFPLYMAVVGLTLVAGSLIFLNKKKNILPLLVMVGSLLLTPATVSVYAVDWGDPLTTTNIMLFGYYNHSSWNLSLTVTAFENYTDQSSYYDGWVRVWQDVVNDTYAGNDVYVDCKLRVRSDGYIMAWLDSTAHDPTDCVYWGGERKTGTYTGGQVIPENSTTLARAIERVFYVTGETYPGHDEIYYYDYSQTSATKLVFINAHQEHNTTDLHTYFLIPSANVDNIHQAYVTIGGNGKTQLNEDELFLDGNEIHDDDDPAEDEFGWLHYNVTSYLALDTSHYVYLKLGSDDVGLSWTMCIWLS